MGVKTSDPHRLITLMRSDWRRPGFLRTICRRMPCWVASKPVLQCLLLNPSQYRGTTGNPSSSESRLATLSTSSPMMPVAQEVAMKIARGECLRAASRMVASSFPIPP